MTEVGRLAHDAYKPFFTKVEKVPASIHRIAANDYSRKPGFRHTGFSETKKISGYRRGPGYWRQRFPSPSPFPQGVMWRIHTQMSVPGVTKCHRVQTFLVIGVTIPLVSSCWMRAFSPFPICLSKQPTTRRY